MSGRTKVVTKLPGLNSKPITGAGFESLDNNSMPISGIIRPPSNFSHASNTSLQKNADTNIDEADELGGSGGNRGAQSGSRGDLEGFMETNPFVLPSDEDVFKLREQDKKIRREKKVQLRKLHVHEKTTFSSRMSRTTTGPMTAASNEEEIESPNGTEMGNGAGGAPVDGVMNESNLGTERRRRDKENMTDFIAKKREIFLVQMSLDTKRAEIRKLEERALQREEAIRKSEQMLEEDAVRFDDFLKENNEKVQDAIRKAEIQARAKQDKVVEIKRLNAAIATIRSELNKYEELLEDCKKYKEFLDKLTPHEWFKEQEVAKATEKSSRDASFAETMKEYQTALEAHIEGKRTADQSEPSDPSATVEVPLHPGPKPVRPASPLEELPMYFTSSQQLLEVLAQLEEQNLFLIQNFQETEEALEELKQKHRDTKQRMDQEVEGLQSQIEQLQLQIQREEDKARILKGKAGEHASGRAGSHDTTLEDLSAKVADVYVRCGFDHDPSITTLQMLTNIEAKLEEYLSIVDLMPEETVEQMERAKEKERRHRAREEKLEQQRREQEKRVQRALERAQAPVHKKTGKPQMIRSTLKTNKKKDTESGPKKSDEEEELQAFLKRQDY